jgi:putative transposase
MSSSDEPAVRMKSANASPRRPSASKAEQHDDWIEGRRYLGLEVLAKSWLALIEITTEELTSDTDLKALSA